MKRIRIAKQMTQGDICRKLGVDRAYISNVESGNKNPNGNDAGGNKNSVNDMSSNPGNYTLAYSSPINFRIMYDESRLGIGRNKSDYRLILKQLICLSSVTPI